MKNFKDTIGNRTRNLPACTAVPQPSAPLLTSLNESNKSKYVNRAGKLILEGQKQNSEQLSLKFTYLLY